MITEEMIEAGLLKVKNNYRPLVSANQSIDERKLVERILTAALSASPAGVVKPLETAPSGPDAMMPSSVDVHEGAWAWVIGTNGKKAGWVDTHALFAHQLYRDSILSAIEPAGVKTDQQQDIEDIHKLAEMVGATFKPHELAGVGMEAVIRDAVDEAVSRAEIEWSYHEDNHRYPRDFWHAQISFGSFDSGWRSYGKQEQRELPDDVKATAEAELRDELRSHLLSPFAALTKEATHD